MWTLTSEVFLPSKNLGAEEQTFKRWQSVAQVIYVAYRVGLATSA